MNDLNIRSGGAAHGLVASVAGAFTAKTGFGIKGEFGAVGAMADQLRNGAAIDMIILTSALVEALAAEKLVASASIRDVGLVETALAVRRGDPKVSAGNEGELRAAFLAADAIFVPDIKASTAGVHVAKVLTRLGIADEVASRLQVHPNGATAMREMAASAARRPIGCTQSTEIVSASGVALSGPLPGECGLATMYTAGITTNAAHGEQAQTLIALLTEPGAQGERSRLGFLSPEQA